MNKMAAKLLVSILFIYLPAKAHQAKTGQLLASLGVGFNQTLTDNINNVSPHRNLEFSLLFEANTTDWLGIEVGLFSGKFQYFLQNSQVQRVDEVRRIHIPIIFRFWLLHSLSIGVGPYASYTTGEVDTLLESGNYQEYKSSAFDTAEHGFETSIQWDHPLNASSYIVLDARYSRSVTPRENESYQQQSALIYYKHILPKPKAK